MSLMPSELLEVGVSCPTEIARHVLTGSNDRIGNMVRRVR